LTGAARVVGDFRPPIVLAMRPRPLTSVLITATTAAALTLAGCGGSKEPAAAPGTPAASAPATQPGTPTVTAPPRTPAPTKTPTNTSGQTEGDGDSEGDDTPATAGGGICSDLEAGDVGRILGGSAKGAALPGGGCGFTQTAAKGPAATFIEKSFAKTPGGMAGAKTEATSSVEGDPVDVGGIGDAAFVVTGTAFGGPDIQGAGAVRVGDRLVNITLTQSTGLTRAEVKAMVIKLLKLAAVRAG
jgi:hypothetical protein